MADGELPEKTLAGGLGVAAVGAVVTMPDDPGAVPIVVCDGEDCGGCGTTGGGDPRTAELAADPDLPAGNFAAPETLSAGLGERSNGTL